MSSRFSSVLEAPQFSSGMEGLLATQAIGLYDQNPIPAYSKAFSVFTLHAKDPYDQTEPVEIVNRQLNHLRRFYTLVGEDDLIADVLQDVPALPSLLSEAVKPLQEAFGESTMLRLEVLTSDEDTTLRVVAKPSSDVTDTADRMRQFKRSWWRNNIARSRASLSFDYE